MFYIEFQDYFNFFKFGQKKRRKDNLERTQKNLKTIKEAQRGTPYARWIAYLKKKKLYVSYKLDIIKIFKNTPIYGSTQPMDAILNCFTKAQVEEVVNYIDTALIYNKVRWYARKWQPSLDDFLSEECLEERKRILAKRLYHMDSPNVKHAKYVGSEFLEKRLLDKIIDTILFIKR